MYMKKYTNLKSLQRYKDGLIEVDLGKNNKKIDIKKHMVLNRQPEPNRKGGFKGILKKTFGVLTICGIYLLAIKGVAYASAVSDNQLDFTEREYHQNYSVEPGYYNEKPITICISEQFNDLSKNQIAKGIEYLDEKAEGLKFEYFYGAVYHEQADIYILKGEFETFEQLGEANLGSMSSTQIRGRIVLKEDVFSQLALRPVLVHELCHVIGLSHSKDVNSIMFPTISTYKMSKQDIENLNKIYPDEIEKE